MKLDLKSFQTEYVVQLRQKANQARHEAGNGGEDQALVFSAPTGSGKTVMAAALMESLVRGDEENDPDPTATFLWITDQPELNTQTRRKLLACSDLFTEQKLITIEAATFNQPQLDPGNVYFLNTQKLARTSKLVSRGDKRKHTIWSTIANTAQAHRGSFWVVLDEAHRGMLRSGSDDELAETIPQKFILGSPDDGLPPVRLILGISATPDRFNNVLDKTTRTKRHVQVDAEEVRSSGLLKSRTLVYHTDEAQPSNLTLLEAAAKKLKLYEDQWAEYAKRETSPVVRPILVVQVEDGTKSTLTRTDLVAALDVVEKALEIERPEEVAHSFQEDQTMLVGDTKPLRYVPAADIELDPHLRVVFFKRSLTTGWDCPRAEVMMSFRSARDETLIAQLVGRMVRTPLAREVGGSDLLNSVCLYLPEYDKETVRQVIARLSEPDPSHGLAGGEVESGNRLVTLNRAPNSEAIFEAAKRLSIYKAEPVARTSGVRRLFKLGRRLAWDGIDKAAQDGYEAELLGMLDKERQRRSRTRAYKQEVEEAGLIDVTELELRSGEVEASVIQTLQLRASERNIDQAFAEAGRKLGEGLHKAYLKTRASAAGAPSISEIKRELFVLVSNPKFMEGLEARAEELCDTALEKHKVKISDLSEDKRDEYRRIGRQGKEPKPEPWEPPVSIDGLKEGEPMLKHILVKEDGVYSAPKWTSLEDKVLAAELARDDVVGWLRNDDRKNWSFSINYRRHGVQKNMYPDFLFFREEAGGIICDVMEPHTQSKSDSVAKARGLAEYAERHAQDLGRIELLDEVDGKIKRLRLTDAKVRKKVLAVEGEGHLLQLFQDAPDD